MSWKRLLCLSALCCCLSPTTACAPGGPPGADHADALRLSLAAPAHHTLMPGDTLELAWLVARQSSGPAAGQQVQLSIISPGDPGGTLSQTELTSDLAGIVRVEFLAGTNPLVLPIQVQATLDTPPAGPDSPQRAAFTVEIKRPTVRLQPYPATRTAYDAPGGGNLRLAVQALALVEGGATARPLANTQVAWRIVDDSVAESQMVEPETVTDQRGVTWAELRCGPLPATVTVMASMAGAPPVLFTVDVLKWGSCNENHPCPLGWSCRNGACLQDAPECARDDQCGPEQRCRFGQCVTASPQGPPCKHDRDCASDETCVAGFCNGCEGASCPCVNVTECPEGFLCTDQQCACDSPDCGGDLLSCATPPPDLTGHWTFETTYYFREALPGWVDDIMGVLGPVFRFLASGIFDGFVFDIPIIGDALAAAANAAVSAFVPRWVGELLDTLGNFNEILNTLRVTQRVKLWPTTVPHQYTGTLEMTDVEMVWRGAVHRGKFDEITDYHVSPQDIQAEAQCDVLFIRRHTLGFGMGKVVRWALDVATTGVTEGQYFSLRESLVFLSRTCESLAGVVEGIANNLAAGLGLSLPNLYSLVRSTCENSFLFIVDNAIEWLESIEIRIAPATVEGQATISHPRRLDNGIWRGALGPFDFSGEFTGRRN